MFQNVLKGRNTLVQLFSAATLVFAFFAFSSTEINAQDAANGIGNPYAAKADIGLGIEARDLGTWTKAEAEQTLSTWLVNNLPGLDSAPLSKRYQALYYKLILNDLTYDIAVEVSLIENFEKAKAQLPNSGSLSLNQMRSVYINTVENILP